MDVIICGAGEVGSHAAEILAAAGHDITVIDNEQAKLSAVADAMDVGTLLGNCANATTLREAGAADADMLVAATQSDELNLLTASIAKGIGTRKSIARVHHSAFFERQGLDYQAHFNIDDLICPEYSTATAIARTLRNPAALAIEHFAHGRIDMQEFPVSDNAPALGKPLSDLGMPANTRLVAVTRNGEVFVPEAGTQIESGDRVFLVGNTDVFDDARSLFYRDSGGRKKVVIMGGPAMAVWLARELHDRNWSIRLFETNRQRAEELAEKLEWVTVLCADPTNRDVFAEEKLGLVDVFIAMREEDEVNIIGCVLAKSMGVTEVVAVVQRPNYLDLLYHIGVDRPFSPRMVATKEIEIALDDKPMRLLASLADGYIDAYRIRVSDKAELSGKTLRDIRFGADLIVAAISRHNAAWVPGPDDTITAGDTVLVVCPAGTEKNLKKHFGI